jgi:hypothetical protein
VQDKEVRLVGDIEEALATHPGEELVVEGCYILPHVAPEALNRLALR